MWSLFKLNVSWRALHWMSVSSSGQKKNPTLCKCMDICRQPVCGGSPPKELKVNKCKINKTREKEQLCILPLVTSVQHWSASPRWHPPPGLQTVIARLCALSFFFFFFLIHLPEWPSQLQLCCCIYALMFTPRRGFTHCAPKAGTSRSFAMYRMLAALILRLHFLLLIHFQLGFLTPWDKEVITNATLQFFFLLCFSLSWLLPPPPSLCLLPHSCTYAMPCIAIWSALRTATVICW